MNVSGVRAVNYVRLSQYENKEIINMTEDILDTLPEKTPLVAVITPAKLPPVPSNGPTNLDAVMTPTR